jgi:hypothetical protein
MFFILKKYKNLFIYFMRKTPHPIVKNTIFVAL